MALRLRARDYDTIDRLLVHLHALTGVRYMVGNDGTVNNFADTPLCWYFNGDTVLYNPDRLTNLNPIQLASRPQVAHNANSFGLQVRRSLPLCDRSTNFEPLEQLIDGPPQLDRCNMWTLSGLVWTQVEAGGDRDATVVASLGRVMFKGVPNSSFDVVTVHPMSTREREHAGPIDEFIAGVTSPPYRTTEPYFPVLAVGDYNELVQASWPFYVADDVIAASVGTGALRPRHGLSLGGFALLPNEDPCRGPVRSGSSPTTAAS